MSDRPDRIENILTGLVEKLDRTEAIEATNNALDTKFNQTHPRALARRTIHR